MVANRATYNIKVANMSLGSDGCSSGVDPLSAAVNNAVAAGIAMVVAVTVGAAGAVSDDPYTLATGLNLAYFSSRGPTLDGRSKPDLVAPGVNVRSALAGTIAGYTDESGTSMASPFVAGLAALMLDVNPGLSPAQVKSILMSTANDRGAPGTDPEWGAGLRPLPDRAVGAESAAAHDVGGDDPARGRRFSCLHCWVVCVPGLFLQRRRSFQP